jgi:CRP-like cAMP-binding protein
LPEQLTSNRHRNRILNALEDGDLTRLEDHLTPVTLKFRQRLERANEKIQNAYFPNKGIASVVAIGSKERRQAEVALVGRDGMTGLAIVLGTDRSPHDTFMQVPGEGLSISADDLRRAMDESSTMRACFLRYVQVFTVQSAHSALANAQGKLEERLARWLLMAHDRINGDELDLTHEFLALMLGVRRAGVTTGLHQLEKQGLVSMARSSVVILDREGLQECANGLYGTPEAEFEHLFGGI